MITFGAKCLLLIDLPLPPWEVAIPSSCCLSGILACLALGLRTDPWWPWQHVPYVLAPLVSRDTQSKGRRGRSKVSHGLFPPVDPWCWCWRWPWARLRGQQTGAPPLAYLLYDCDNLASLNLSFFTCKMKTNVRLCLQRGTWEDDDGSQPVVCVQGSPPATWGKGNELSNARKAWQLARI